ncbi:helix-turn-helix domain-containing protein [Fulvivirgaceae bacterium BMA12]|uniref:Helix-turn-helix domain-containing protein n=1 Tax=Agaribacillus aureus TaxID=3051825 RepID=A0ABT8KZD4_9BACT|nr:helix-turn-helix domain-containing protein [Fulvivirgaceae bacterium BMA12]
MYQLFAPPGHLSNVVRYYWLLDLSAGKQRLTEYLFAYPYVNWVFTLGTPYSVKDNVELVTVRDTRILGPRSNFAEYVHPEGNLAFGVTFQLGSTLPIFQEEVKDLTNKIILQDEILPSVNWLTSCFRHNKLDVFLGYLNNFMEKRNYVTDRNGFVSWNQFLTLLFNGKHYATGIDKLSRKLGVSQRHLQRVTLKYSGFTPKQVQSMLRCRLAIRHIRQTGLTKDFFFYGYYDQNHFIKEVKRWSGYTPKQLLSFLN